MGEEIVNSCLPSDCGGGKRVVAGDHDGLDAHCAELIEAFLHAALDHIFQFDYAQRAASLLSNDQRSASGASNLFHRGLYPHRHFAVILQEVSLDGVRRALSDFETVQVHS